MKLKPWLWGGLAVLVLGGGAVFYVAIQPPFSFLAGRAESSLTQSDMKQMARDEIELSVYSFKADWNGLVTTAGAELQSAGFKVAPNQMGPNVQEFYDPDRDAMSKSSGSEEGRAVLLMKDLRYDARTGIMGLMMEQQNAKGWVTVVVAQKGNQSLWASFTKWLGL